DGHGSGCDDGALDRYVAIRRTTRLVTWCFPADRVRSGREHRCREPTPRICYDGLGLLSARAILEIYRDARNEYFPSALRRRRIVDLGVDQTMHAGVSCLRIIQGLVVQ